MNDEDEMKTKTLLAVSLIASVVTIVLMEPALAQGIDIGGDTGGDTKWYSFIVDGLNLVAEGVGAIVAVFLGLGLMGWGAWGALKGRLEPERALIMVIGGIVALAGPAIASGLLSFIEQ
ncbi:MAG TPA: hypothetical protein DHR80_13030 [Thalassospira lucentensis]|uniref:TrbC/VirB2 family protein n=2 Tax=Thalassospiraceae TaxID=2844866 RepID=A0A3D5NAD4_9PROT|nr:hypothetical protein [Thalassospira lucentensis]|tara:strand:+ start:230 stop:586 length:357 start_codon:yes stop_codon:yes gene_type:complete